MGPNEPPLSELLRRAYLCPDRRSLAIGRICIGLVLLGDLGRYVSEFDLWLGADGLLPIPPFGPQMAPHLVSVLFYRPGPVACAIAIAVCALLDVALVLGWHTKAVQILALAALINLQSRAWILVNGGDRCLCIYLFWTLFLPMGDYFSLDARRSGHRPENASPSVSGALAAPTIAFAALLVQLAAVYLISAALKTANLWVDGYAIAQFYNDPSLTNTIGCALARHAPLGALKLVTRAARAIEFVGPLLLLSPLSARRARHLAIILLTGLHLGILTTMNVGIFSYVMIAFYPMLLMEQDWVTIGRFTLRLRAWLARRPWGRGLAAAWERARARVPPQVPPPLGERTRRALRIGREVTVALFLVGCFEEGIAENIDRAQMIVPPFVRAIVEYPNLHQAWGMFIGEHELAPGVVVDAETIDGRHVDPLSEIDAPAAASEPRPWSVLPQCMNTSTFFQSFTYRLRNKKPAQAALGAWILRYPRRTGRPEDTIIRYSIYQYYQRIDLKRSEANPWVRKVLLARYPDPSR